MRASSNVHLMTHSRSIRQTETHVIHEQRAESGAEISLERRSSTLIWRALLRNLHDSSSRAIVLHQRNQVRIVQPMAGSDEDAAKRLLFANVA